MKWKEERENVKPISSSCRGLLGWLTSNSNSQHDPDEPPGLSWNVYRRLETLKNMEQRLKRHDPYKQLCNVQSIIKDYRSGRLVWSDELVTFWREGEQIGRPVPFNWDFFERLSARYRNTGGGIWVEAVCLLQSIMKYLCSVYWGFGLLTFFRSADLESSYAA